MAKRGDRVEIRSGLGLVQVGSIGFVGQTGRGSKQIIFKWVNQVTGRVGFTRIFQTSFFYFFIFYFNYKNKSMKTCLERMNKIN